MDSDLLFYRKHQSPLGLARNKAREIEASEGTPKSDALVVPWRSGLFLLLTETLHKTTHSFDSYIHDQYFAIVPSGLFQISLRGKRENHAKDRNVRKAGRFIGFVASAQRLSSPEQGDRMKSIKLCLALFLLIAGLAELRAMSAPRSTAEQNLISSIADTS